MTDGKKIGAIFTDPIEFSKSVNAKSFYDAELEGFIPDKSFAFVHFLLKRGWTIGVPIDDLIK